MPPDQNSTHQTWGTTRTQILTHAIRNNPHTFSRYANHCRAAGTNELLRPKKPLTYEQVKHEKGVFYDGPVGDRLPRLMVILDDVGLLQLAVIFEFAKKSRSYANQVSKNLLALVIKART